MSVIQSASEDPFVERVRTLRAVKQYSSAVKEMVERHTMAATISARTSLWVYDMPSGYDDVYKAGRDRNPVHFVLDPSGIDGPDEVVEECFTVTEDIAVLDMRESIQRDDDPDLMEMLKSIIGETTRGLLPFNVRYFAACLKGTGIRGFLWENHGMILTLFAPGPTYLARRPHSPAPGTTKDPALYCAIGLTLNKPCSPSKKRACKDTVRWNKLEKMPNLKELDEVDLDALYKQGTALLDKLLREDLNGTPFVATDYERVPTEHSSVSTNQVTSMQGTEPDNEL